MNTDELVKAFYNEKHNLLKEYLSENSETEIRQLIKSLNLTNKQNEIMGKILDTSLTGTFYTVLLDLNGSASIGGKQELYNLKDQKGNQLSGEIEGIAYEYFHENK